MKYLKVTTRIREDISEDDLFGLDDLTNEATSKVSLNELKKSVQETINSILEIVDSPDLKSKGFEVKEVKFEISIDEDGESSLITALSKNSGFVNGIGLSVKRIENG